MKGRSIDKKVVLLYNIYALLYEGRKTQEEIVDYQIDVIDGSLKYL